MVLEVSGDAPARSDGSCFLCDYACSVISAISEFVSRIFSNFGFFSADRNAADLLNRVSSSSNLEEMRRKSSEEIFEERRSEEEVSLEKDPKGKEEADPSEDAEGWKANPIETQSSPKIFIQEEPLESLGNALKEWADGVKGGLQSYPLETGSARWFLEKNLGALETRIRIRFLLSEGSLESREAFVFQELLGFLKYETKFISDPGIKKMLLERTFSILRATEASFFRDCNPRFASNYRRDLQELREASQSFSSE